MKITLICQEIPYPAINGSRIDMWRRIKAFADRGVELQVIFWWFGTAPIAETIAEIYKYASKVHSFEIERTARARLSRVTDLLIYPLETSSRLIKGQKLDELVNEVREFSPDVIFLDGIHGGMIATKLSQDLSLPLVTRSHNIEHIYAQKMLKAASSLKDKFRRYLALFHLEKTEKNLLSNSALFYDISADDLNFWQGLNFTNGRLLSPIIDFSTSTQDLQTHSNLIQLKSYDLVFLGSLNMENNVAGVIWFLTEVLPLIRERLPNVSVLIAGLNPIKRIKDICKQTAGVSLSINPISAFDTYQLGKVLINPILTGSGVKIKSIDMLATGLPIVSTREGVSGLPTIIKQYFKIADDRIAFADAAIEFLSTNCERPKIDRQLLKSYFGDEIIDSTIADLQSLV